MLTTRFFVIGILLFSTNMAGATSNPPITATSQNGKQEQKKEANSDKRGTKDVPLVVEMISTHENNKSINEELIAYGTLALAIVTAFLAWFTFRLWKATGKLVVGAENTAERQLRAYILHNNDEEMDHNGGRIKVTVRIKNFGQTPAHKLRCWLFMGFYKFPLDVPLDAPDYEKGSLSTLGPTGIITQTIELPAALNQAEFNAVLKGEGAIYVSGELYYFDVFNVERSTKFRFVSTGNDFSRCKLAVCNEGNVAT